jgi:hypothetical protein
MCVHEATVRSGFFLTASSHALPSHPPPTSTMASISRRQNGRDVVLPTLDVFIQTINIAKDACGVPPAQIALGSASTLLAMIRVRFPMLLREHGLLAHAYLGHIGQLSRLCRPRAELRECMSSIVPKIGGKKAGRAQPGRPGCDWRPDHVSQTSDSHDKGHTYR